MAAKSRNPWTIEVTSEVVDGRILLRIHGKDIWLPKKPAIALLCMIAERLTTKNGYTPYSLFAPGKRMAHSRASDLRDALDRQFGRGASAKIFEHSADSNYKILPESHEIFVDQSINELVDWFLPRPLVDELLSVPAVHQHPTRNTPARRA